MRNNKSILLLIAITLFLSSSYFIYYETENKTLFNLNSMNEDVAGLEDKTSHVHSISFSEFSEGKICEKCGGTGQILTAFRMTADDQDPLGALLQRQNVGRGYIVYIDVLPGLGPVAEYRTRFAAQHLEGEYRRNTGFAVGVLPRTVHVRVA